MQTLAGILTATVSLRLRFLRDYDLARDTIGLDSDKVIQLDDLRKARNVADYSGDPITEKELETCLALADELCSKVNNWLKTNELI